MERIIIKDENKLLITIILEDGEYSLKVRKDYVVLSTSHSESNFDKLFKELGLTSKKYSDYLCDWIKEAGLQLDCVFGKTSPEYKNASEKEQKKLLNIIYNNFNSAINPKCSETSSKLDASEEEFLL